MSKFKDVGRKNVNRDLKKVAEHLWSRVKEGERFVTSQIEFDYDLTEPQCGAVKRNTRDLAIKSGALWGYCPSLNAFLIAPSNAPLVAEEIIAYSGNQWRNAGIAHIQVIEAAKNQGFVDARALLVVRAVQQQFEVMISNADEAFRDKAV